MLEVLSSRRNRHVCVASREERDGTEYGFDSTRPDELWWRKGCPYSTLTNCKILDEAAINYREHRTAIIGLQRLVFCHVELGMLGL